MTTSTLTEALENWLHAHGGRLHRNLRIVQDSEAGVYWLAKDTIEPGTTVIEVPNTLSLSYLNGLVDDAFPVFKTRRAAFKIEAIGFFYLITQYIHRETSFWRPYLDTLPSPDQEFTQPLWFQDAADVSWLEGTDVWHASEARREIYEQYYKSGIAALKEANIDTSPYTWHLFKWAVSMFSSRSFTSRSLQPQDGVYWTAYKSEPGGQRTAVLLDMSNHPVEDQSFPVLFPAMDASNHRHDAKVEWYFDRQGFRCTALEATAAGAEVWNNYGAKSNDELLLGYGFCIPQNPHDTVLMTLKPPPADLQRTLQRLDPEYFTPDGPWNPDKATFRLSCPSESTLTDTSSIFTTLPVPLVRLLLFIIHHERDGTYADIAQETQQITTGGNPPSRFLPHIARMLVQSLASKLSKLPAPDAPPKSPKQTQVAIYLQSQHHIITSLIASLRAFTRSLLVYKDINAITAQISPSHLFTLEALHAYIFPNHTSPSPFLQGLAESTGTTDIQQLRLAGWEEDTFVLLLAWLYLKHGVEGDEVPSKTGLGVTTSENDEQNDDEDVRMAATSLHPLIDAAAASLPDTFWADRRWMPRVTARWGARVLREESFMVMCPVSEERGGQVEEEPRLCVYLHTI